MKIKNRFKYLKQKKEIHSFDCGEIQNILNTKMQQKENKFAHCYFF